MNHRRILALLGVALSLVASGALAQSSINTGQPATDSNLNSLVIRQLALAAASDINGILGMHTAVSAGQCPASPPVGTDCLLVGSTPYTWTKWTGSSGGWATIGTIDPVTGVFSPNLASTSILGTAPVAVHFSGGVATLSLTIDTNFLVNGSNQLSLAPIASGHLLANCTGSGAEPADCTWNSFANTAIGNSNGQLPYRIGGVWGTISTGTSGASLPQNNSANIFSALQTVNLNAAGLPAALAGTVLNFGDADSSVARIQGNAFGAAVEFTGAAYGGTNASQTAVLSGAAVTRINAYAYNGAALVGSIASLEFSAAENIASGHQGSTACVKTTPLASTTLAAGLCQQPSSGVTVGSPTGGDKGAGSVNAASLFVNGVAVASSATAITALTGDIAATGPGSVAATLATVNSNVGSFGSATQSPQFAVNAKGLVTSAANVTITPAIGSITGLGANVATWLATPTSANLAAALTDETGSAGGGVAVFSNAPALTAPTITGGTHTGVTSLGLRDISAAFDVTLAANSSVSLTAGRTLTFDVGNVAHTLKFGTTANTITFPNLASYTVITSGDSQTVTSAMLANSLSLVTPNINAAIGTSLALGGSSIGSNALAVTGTFAFSAGGTFGGALSGITTLASGAHTITSTSALALVVGPNGTSNPTFVVDNSSSVQSNGLKVSGTTAGSGASLTVISSTTNEGLSINAKGGGGINIGNLSGGNVTITPPLLTNSIAGTTISGSTLIVGAGSAVTSSGPGGALGSNAFTSTAFLPISGLVAMTGNLNMGGNSINGALSVTAVTFIGDTSTGTPNSLTQTFNTNQTVAGTTSANCVTTGGLIAQFPCANLFNISADSADGSSPSNAMDGWQFNHTFGGSTLKGARQSLDVTANFTAPSSASNTNRNYVPLVSQMNILSGDGGTGLTPSLAKGSFFAGNDVVRSNSSATNLLSSLGRECDVSVLGSSVVRGCYSAVSFPSAQGALFDYAFGAGSVTGAGAISWKVAYAIVDANGGPGLDATVGCIICGIFTGGPYTIATGFDASNFVISGNYLNGPGGNFSVPGAGTSLNLSGRAILAATAAGTATLYNIFQDSANNNAFVAGGGGSSPDHTNAIQNTTTKIGSINLSTVFATFTTGASGISFNQYGLGILHSSSAGGITSSAVSLTADVTGILPGANGGTGVNNGSSTLTLAGSVIHAGAFTTTLTATATTNATLPAGTHTLAGIDVANIFTAGQTINAASSNIILGGGPTPQIFFSPSAGSTKVGEFYQQGDNWFVASSGVGNWLQVNLANGQTSVLASTASTSTATGSLLNAGGFGNTGAIYGGAEIATGAVAVASLPTCDSAHKAARYFVTNANTTFTAGIGAVVAGGGANNVPVICDGVNWRVGANDNMPLNLMRKFA